MNLTPLNILLADDDQDDRFFFEETLKTLPIPIHLTTVEDGEKLMNYLFKNTERLPDILFLDLNMPRRNGSECLTEIKLNKKLQHLPVIIYSTSVNEMIADELFKNGAHQYIKKTDLTELRKILHYILSIAAEKKLSLPPRNKFVLSSSEAFSGKQTSIKTFCTRDDLKEIQCSIKKLNN